MTLGFARGAAAYPQFQFSSGTNKCSQCHYAPAGGGLLSSWGRSESGDTISMGGDGGFLHGAVTLPSWFALGLDLRLAATRTDDGGDGVAAHRRGSRCRRTSTRASRSATRSRCISRAACAARCGRRRIQHTGIGQINVDFGTVGDRFISREHYLMWRPSATGPYARLGRFYAPYGIRFVEHIYFVRRYAGYELYNETYNRVGRLRRRRLGGSRVRVHAAADRLSRPLQSVGARESGGAAYFE